MVKPLKQLTILVVIVLSILSVLAIPFNKAIAARSQNGDSPAVIFLTASWCGTCREVSSILDDIVKTYPNLGLKLVVLDVDQNSTPATANSYGIMVTGADVPQIYLVSHGKTSLLFNGRDYKFGQSKLAEERIREQLQNNL